MADSDQSQSDNQSNQQSSDQSQAATINADFLGEHKDDPVFKAFYGKPVTELLKSFKSAQSLIGGEKLVIPAGKLDNPENWNHVFDKLGRPKDADGYKLTRPQLPEGMNIDEGMEKAFKQVVHYLGVLPWQAEGLYQFYNKIQVDAFNQVQAAENKRAEETESALVQKLGTKEKYDEYVKGADAALKRFGGDPQTVQAFLDKFGNDPLVVEVFGNVAKGMIEDAALRGDKSFNLLGDDAGAKVKDILYNKDNPLNKAYFDKSHPQHQHAVDEVARLNTLVHGDKPINMAG